MNSLMATELAVGQIYKANSLICEILDVSTTIDYRWYNEDGSFTKGWISVDDNFFDQMELITKKKDLFIELYNKLNG
jgi:hypothetical protein